ncbi:sigma-70 family RNA polymerase sigma factor [Namhaeicola litoreus]|uniref:Sigma-70 family RNA polymerase sigma factor n=1 Tax=Namhaeicola litoreus TaxID=1052145 RepID=A0ABW3Y1L6_9FLAO
MTEQKTHELNPEKWVQLHSDFLFQYAVARVSNHDMAKDLVQETFFSGLKGLEGFRGQASERTWLISILKRKIIDYYRKINSDKGKREINMSFFEEGENQGGWIEALAPKSWDNFADKDIENTELGKVLNDCIQRLPEKYKIVFLLKTESQYESEDICNELGISASNLWVIIHRARVQLRKCIETNWFNK